MFLHTFSSKMNYTVFRNIILEICPYIGLHLKSIHETCDGRLMSAALESEVVKILVTSLDGKMDIVIPKDRNWFDIRIGGVPINIKITNGGADNAFNKVAVIHTLTGWEPEQKNMNFNQFYRHLLEHRWKRERNPLHEYHYLVFEKNTGNFILRSILDIEAFQSNPSNILQINWKNEFQREEPVHPKDPFLAGIQIVELCQKSLKKALEASEDFIRADLGTEITLVNLGLDPREAPACRDAFDQF